MVSITCYGGVNEIGGNKILIEDNKTRIFLDFGQSFSLLDDYFMEYLQPRTRFGLKDYFYLDLMPKLEGLYNDWAVEKTGLMHKEPEYHGVFISHAHYDHIAHLKYLDQRIPIYLGETAKSIINSMNETTNLWSFHEKERTTRDGKTVAQNTVNTFRTGDSIKIDDLEILPVHVDHSIPGAYGFIVYTSEGAIAYSGDLRRHGNKPKLTQDFIEKAKEAVPEVLIMEGTRVVPEEKRKNYSENEVYSNSEELIKDKKELTIAMRYPRDMDRLRTFYELAKNTGKELVISLKTAHLLIKLQNDKHLDLPHPFNDDNVKIYKRDMKIYKPWESPLLFACVDSKWVKENQKNIIWELDFYQLTELIDVEPTGGFCIHSMSEPFEEDPASQMQEEILQNWLKRFSLEYHQLHASGHSSMEEIFNIVCEIDPAKVMPVHTNNAELFEKTEKKTVRLEKGQKIVL